MKPLRVSWSLMRCVFAFEICLVHVTARVWNLNDDSWLAATTYMALGRAGTIGFMMLAGAILIPQPATPVWPYLAHRVGKWAPPLLLAQGLYLAVALHAGKWEIADLTLARLVAPAENHIWFFYALGVIYLAVVPMRLFAAWALARPGQVRRLALWGPTAALAAGIGAQTALGGFWGELRPLNLLVYCGYAWTGFVLHHSLPRGALAAVVPAAAALATVVLITDLASAAAGAPVTHYIHRGSLFSATVACGQFLLLLRLTREPWPPEVTSRVHALARLTLGIYIVHMLLLDLSGWSSWWRAVPVSPWISLPLFALVVLAASAMVVALFLGLVQRGPARGGPGLTAR